MNSRFLSLTFDGVLLLMFYWIPGHTGEGVDLNQQSVITVAGIKRNEAPTVTSGEIDTTPEEENLPLCSACSFVKHEIFPVVNCTSKFFPEFPLDCPSDTQLSLMLEELDLSYTKLNISRSHFEWPPTLRILHVGWCALYVLPNIAALQNLEQLHASGNYLRALPKINRNSSITYIDLRDNPLDTVDVSILAPLCNLDYLGIRVTESGTLNKPGRFCHCARLKKWIKMTSLRGEEKLICNSGNRTRTEESCEEELIFSADIMNDYNQCLQNEPATSLWELLLFALFFSVLFPIIYFTYEAYNKYGASHEEIKAIAKKRSHNSESAIESSRYSYEMEEEYESTYESEHSRDAESSYIE